MDRRNAPAETHVLRRPWPAASAFVLVVMIVASMQWTATSTSADTQASDDVRWYARSEGVSLQEAERRLALQDDAGRLQERLRAVRPGTFAGLWIQHRPEFRIVAAFTQDASSLVVQSTRGTPLERLVDHRIVRHSLQELRAELSSLEWLSTQRVADLLVDVKRNAVEVRTVSARELYDAVAARGQALSEATVIVEVPALNRPAADIYGGLDISCTTGFGVLNNGTADRGITTAGHCDNSLSYNGTNMTFQLESMGSNHDEQWHTITGYTVRNWVRDYSGTRSVTSRTARSSQVVGEQVCKFGRVTGWGCGNITSVDSTGCQNGGTQHIYLQAQQFVDLVDSGDSGSPTFRSNSAYGLISCMAGTGYVDGIYIAVDYVESGLGVTVLTSP